MVVQGGWFKLASMAGTTATATTAAAMDIEHQAPCVCVTACVHIYTHPRERHSHSGRPASSSPASASNGAVIKKAFTPKKLLPTRKREERTLIKSRTFYLEKAPWPYKLY